MDPVTLQDVEGEIIYNVNDKNKSLSQKDKASCNNPADNKVTRVSNHTAKVANKNEIERIGVIAELANPVMRAKLKLKNLWQKVVDAIAKILGISPRQTTAYTEAYNALNTILDNYDSNADLDREYIGLIRTQRNYTNFLKKMEDGKTLMTSGTYFSGGGLLEEGLKGMIAPSVAVEYDKLISGVYRNNHGNHIVTADVRNVNPADLIDKIDGEVDYFHASPVCKNFSSAKANAEELELDKETAQSTADFIDAVKPKVVTIENVKGYKNSESLQIILDTLKANCYDYDVDVYNAADFGGYTNRERLIVRAIRDGKLSNKPTPLSPELRANGWFEAVEDLIDDLPEKPNGVAEWMDTRLKAEGIDYRNIDRPLYVFGQGNSATSISHAFADELLPTLRTKSGDVIIMPDGRVLKATPRVLARVTGLSDDYEMPKSDRLAHMIVGNGIPIQLTQNVVAPLLEQGKSELLGEVHYREDEEVEFTEEEQSIVDEAKANGVYMKAPNGKLSKLTPKQWAQVRTEAFKNWFGDWELANLYNRAIIAWDDKDSKGKCQFILSDRAKNRFNELLGGNAQLLIITDDSIRHIKNNHSTNEAPRGQRNLTPEDVVVIPYLINNFDSMELNEEYNNKQGEKAIEIRKRINGVSVVATIQKGTRKQLLVTNFEYVKSGALDASKETPEPNVRNDSDIAKVKKEISKIKNDAKNSSKIVEENGEPKVAWHSGASNIDEFKRDFDKTGIGRQFWGKGFYFSGEQSANHWAEMYEKKTGKKAEIYPVFLNMRNPSFSPIKGEITQSEYDGVIIEPQKTTEGNTDWMYIVGHPNQIKSATKNNGDFSTENNGIYYRQAEQKAEQQKRTAVSVEVVADELGEKVRVINDVNEITDADPRTQSRMRKAKGWCDANTGEVVVVMPNAESEADVMRTIYHEVIGHKGIREMVGEKAFNKFLERVYAGMPESVRKQIVDKAKGNRYDFYEAIEEYIAEMAEGGFAERENASVWKKIVDLFKDLISQARIAFGWKLNERDVK